MDAVTSFASGITALALGNGVALFADGISAKLELHRRAVGGEPGKVDDSLFDDVVDLVVETAFLMGGLAMVQRVIPSTTNSLPTLFLFQIGVIMGLDRFPKTLVVIKTKLLNPRI